MTRKRYNRIRRKNPKFRLATYSAQLEVNPHFVRMSVNQFKAMMLATKLSEP